MTVSDGWFAAAGRIVGTLDRYEIVYSWDRTTYQTRGLAISAGFSAFGSDDFNVGRVENGVLVWWGWMDEQHPAEDLAEAAVALDLRPLAVAP